MLHFYCLFFFFLFSVLLYCKKEIYGLVKAKSYANSFYLFCCFSVFCLGVILLLIKYPRRAFCFLLFASLIYYVFLFYPDICKKIKFLPSSISIKTNHFFVCLICVAVVLGIYSFVLSIHTMPIAEGWYTNSAKLINENGKLPYRDFELLFPPFFTYLIALITKIFGYEIIVLRIVGVIVFVSLGIILFLISYNIFKVPQFALIAAITSALYLQSEVVQIFYDYCRFWDLFALLSVLLAIIAIKNNSKKYMFLCGLSSGLGFLMRQNSGAVLIAYYCVLLCGLFIVTADKKLYARFLGYLLLGVIIPIVVCCLLMFANGTLEHFLYSTTTKAIAGKGGMLTVLFAWIPRTLKEIVYNWKIPSVFILYIVIAYYKFLNHKPVDETVFSKTKTALSISFFVSIFIIIVISIFDKKLAASFSRTNWTATLCYTSFTIVCFVFLYELAIEIFNKDFTKEQLKIHRALFIALGAAISFCYGSGMSGGISQGQSALNICLIVSLMLYLAKNSCFNIFNVLSLVFALSLAGEAACFKFIDTYNWWGTGEAPIYESNYKLNIPGVNGIRVSENTYKGINGIYNDIVKNSSENDKIFVFPHAPIFYSLTNRTSDTYTYVQWFDVSSDKSVIDDIDKLQKNLPKVIVHVHVPEFVISSHESLFRGKGEKCGLRVMDEALQKMELMNYRKVNSYHIQNWDAETYVLFDGEVEFVGEGTEKNPYLIDSKEAFVKFRDYVNSGVNFSKKYFKQTVDIDLENQRWTPIGEFGKNSFYGTYDGNGHSISNLYIYSKDNVGLFGILAGTVKNLGIESGYVSGACVGAIASHGTDDAKIINCYNKARLYGVKGRVGGICDNLNGGSVINCQNYGVINGIKNGPAISYNAEYVENIFPPSLPQSFTGVYIPARE